MRLKVKCSEAAESRGNKDGMLKIRNSHSQAYLFSWCEEAKMGFSCLSKTCLDALAIAVCLMLYFRHWMSWLLSLATCYG